MHSMRLSPFRRLATEKPRYSSWCCGVSVALDLLTMVPLLFGALLWVLLQRASMSSVVETVVLSTLVCAPSVFCLCGRRVPRLLGMTLLAVYAWVGLTLVVVMNIHWPVAGPFWERTVPWLFVITIFKVRCLRSFIFGGQLTHRFGEVKQMGCSSPDLRQPKEAAVLNHDGSLEPDKQLRPFGPLLRSR